VAMNTKVVAGLAGVAVVGVIVGAIVIPRLGSGSEGSDMDAAARAEAARLEREADSPEARAAAESAKRLAEDKALAALKAELAEAEPYTGRTDEQRLADAWAWVNANRPAGRPYNEVEAKMLALMDVMFDGEERSAQWLMNASLIEVEMLRALDTDGDGLVSDEELKAFNDENLAGPAAMEHPYIKEKLDTNGDGVVSDEEMAALQKIMSPDGAFAGVLARAQMEEWDTNRDGVLTSEERESGRAGSENAIRDLAAQQIEAMAANGAFDGEGGEERRAQMLAQMEEGIAQAIGENNEVAAFLTAQKLMEAMRVENLDQQQFQAEMMASLPQPPDYQSFDADGDGTVGPGETEAFQEAMGAYQTKIQEFTKDATSLYFRKAFDHAAGQSDTNGDGRLTPNEWDSRLDMLLAQRDERLFLNSYDLDGSGSVGSDELMTFVDWHKAGSLRADANFDGVVDVRDLEQAMTTYQRLAQ